MDPFAVLPALLREELPDAPASGRSGPSAHVRSAGGFVDAVTLDEALALYHRVRKAQPAATGEIGLHSGASTLSILQALEDAGGGEHFACDPFQGDLGNVGLANVERAGLTSRLRFSAVFPEEAVPGWPKLDFAFIDASHLFDLTVLDFVLIDKRLNVGAVVALHDVWMPALQRVARWAVTNRGYVMEPGSGRPVTPGISARRAIGRALRRLPRADRVFTQDVLHPWSEFEPSGAHMIFLRKTADDNRDWRFFRAF